MGLDPSAREANIRDSVKKFFVDGLHRTDSIPLIFDKGLSSPKVQGTEVDRWVSVNFGDTKMSEMGYQILNIHCCTKKDPEGFRLAQLRDQVMDYLVDIDQTDSMKRITLYRSRATGTWTNIGALLVDDIMESKQFETEDESKYKTLTVRLRWSAKI